MPNSPLQVHQRYQRVVTAWRMAELVADDLLGARGARSLRVEVPGVGSWDDLEEVWADGVHRWQIKDNGGKLGAEIVGELLRSAAAHPGVWLHLAVRVDVEVPGFGKLDALRRLCDRWRGDSPPGGATSEVLVGDELRWFTETASLFGDEAARFVLSRLTVEPAATEHDLERNGKRALAHVFENPNAAWERLRLQAERTTHADQPLDGAALWARLKDFPIRPSVPREGARLRAAWLSSVIEAGRDRAPLAALGIGGGHLLSSVWVEREVILMEDGDGLADEPNAPALGRDDAGPRPLRWTSQMRLLDLVLGGVGDLVAVVAGAGAGKTEILLRTAAELAERAVTDTSSPIPLFVRASSLAVHGAHALAQVSLEAERLTATDLPRVWFVDGFDEVPDSLLEAIGMRLAELRRDPSVLRTVVSTRPARSRTLPAGALVVTLDPWTDRHADELLDRWELHDPKAVEAVRAATARPMLLSSPLVATMALGFARSNPDALGSRASVFHAVLAELLTRWPSARGASEGTATWEAAQAGLTDLAWDLLLDGREEFAIAELDVALRALPRTSRHLAIGWLNRGAGILVKTSDSHLAFSMRPMQEFLAGQALAARTDGEIVPAADLPGLVEVVRNAVAILAEDGATERVSNILTLLTEGWRADFRTGGVLVRPWHLRRVLVAAGIVADSPRSVGTLAEELAACFSAYVAEESSAWVGDRCVTAVREVLRAGGPVAELLRRGCLQALTEVRPSPTNWFAGREVDDSWGATLLHRDVGVRALGVRRLPFDPKSEKGRSFFLAVATEDDGGFDSGGVAVEAGRRLREARGSAGWSALVELLRPLVRPHAVHAKVAAVTLCPDAAPADELAPILVGAWSPLEGPEDLLAALRTVPGGEAAVADALAADKWRHRTPSVTPYVGELGPGPTGTARERLLDLLGCVSEFRPEERELFFEQAGRGHSVAATAALCRHSFRDPSIAVELFGLPLFGEKGARGLRLPRFSEQDSLRLGRAAARHQTVLTALRGLFARFAGSSTGHMSFFPGHAYEPLLRAGDGELHTEYAGWITAQDIRTPSWTAIVPADLCAFDAVKGPMRARIYDWMAQTKVEVDGTRQASSQVANLIAAHPALFPDDELTDQLVSWGRSEREEDRGAALAALLAVPWGPTRRQELGDVCVGEFIRLAEANPNTGTQSFFSTLRVAIALGDTQHTEVIGSALLEAEVGPSLFLEVAQALLLMRIGTDESATSAAHWLIDGWPYDFFLRELNERIDRAAAIAPDYMADRLESVGASRVEDTLSAITKVHRYLPLDRVVGVIRRLQQEPAWYIPIPRRRFRRLRRFGSVGLARDLLDEVVFDLGVPLEAGEIDGDGGDAEN